MKHKRLHSLLTIGKRMHSSVFAQRANPNVTVVVVMVVNVIMTNVQMSYQWKLAICSDTSKARAKANTKVVNVSRATSSVIIIIIIISVAITTTTTGTNLHQSPAGTVVAITGIGIVATNKPLASTTTWSTNSTSCVYARLMCQNLLHIPTAHRAPFASKI